MLRSIRIMLLITLFIMQGLIHHAIVGAQASTPLDLADVPLPVQQLPENGYQVLSGDYLSVDDAIELAASPRLLNTETTRAEFEAAGVTRVYVLDLVLPEDRGWQDSPLLAIVQTTVYDLDLNGSPGRLADLLTNYTAVANVQSFDPAIENAVTVHTVGSQGEQLRTVIVNGSIVIEVVSLDATGMPDAVEHNLIVGATLDRLHDLRDSGSWGDSSVALTVESDARTGNFAHATQTGVHGVYRYRGGAWQPAIGEIGMQDTSAPNGLQSIYLGSQTIADGGGVGVASLRIESFDNEGDASARFMTIQVGAPNLELTDPYFAIAADEEWTPQGVLGLYRVTGTLNSQPYSGMVEIRQVENHVVATSYRSVGAVLPHADISSLMMDQQIDCLQTGQLCPPLFISLSSPAPDATPVIGGDDLRGNQGWVLGDLGPNWSITDTFHEPGYDRLELRSSLSIVSLETVINHHGDPVQCVLDELHMLQNFEEHSVITLWQDDAGNTDAGANATHAWTTYHVEPLADERADQEYAIRIDCMSLVPLESNLVMTQIAPIDYWQEEAPLGDYVREHIILPVNFQDHDKISTIRPITNGFVRMNPDVAQAA